MYNYKVNPEIQAKSVVHPSTGEVLILSGKAKEGQRKASQKDLEALFGTKTVVGKDLILRIESKPKETEDKEK